MSRRQRYLVALSVVAVGAALAVILFRDQLPLDRILPNISTRSSAPSAAVSPTTPIETTRSPLNVASPSAGPSDATFMGQVGSPGGSGAATGLNSAPGCDNENTPVVSLSWTIASSRGEEQLVNLTKFPNGFETGRFSVSPKLGPEVSNYVWRGVEPGVQYQWRVITKHGASYTPSEVASFRGPDCLADR